MSRHEPTVAVPNGNNAEPQSKPGWTPERIAAGLATIDETGRGPRPCIRGAWRNDGRLFVLSTVLNMPQVSELALTGPGPTPELQGTRPLHVHQGLRRDDGAVKVDLREQGYSHPGRTAAEWDQMP